MSYKSKDVLNTMAKTAAQQFIKSKKSMNESLSKVASSEGLEPHQVEYVAAEANKYVWADYYQNNKKDSAYSFELADPNAIVGGLQKKPQEKVAMASLDYMVAPNSLKKEAGMLDGQVYGEFATDLTEKNNQRALKAQLTQRYEKLANAREQAGMEATILEESIRNLENKFVKEARQFVIETPFTDRLEALEKIAEFVRATGKIELGQKLMQKLAKQVAKDGLVKEADMKAPEEYISETLPARVINGNHSLYITIDTIAKKMDNLSNMRRDFVIVDDTLPVLKEKIRGL